ncbi:MAG: T9SS type A sorting domain-containing protein, partial [Bacteroidales bacterium]
IQTYTQAKASPSGRFGGVVILGLDPANLKLAYSKGPNIPKDNIVVSDKLRIYPNPASDVINIAYETATDKESVFELYDFSGKLILSNTIKAKTTFRTINLNIVKAGIYYYKLFTIDEILAKNKLIILNK